MGAQATYEVAPRQLGSCAHQSSPSLLIRTKLNSLRLKGRRESSLEELMVVRKSRDIRLYTGKACIASENDVKSFGDAVSAHLFLGNEESLLLARVQNDESW